MVTVSTAFSVCWLTDLSIVFSIVSIEFDDCGYDCDVFW